MGVLAIWRYPVKAMLGELLGVVDVRHAGLVGDRRWVVVDEDTGERIANKRGPTDPALRACRARLIDDAADEHPLAALRVTLPDGEEVGDVAIEPALSELLRRRVVLARADDGAGRPAGLGTPAAHHDFDPIHLLTTRTLAHLRALAPDTTWDARRFRPNVVLDDGDAPGAFSEDALIGRDLHRAGLRLTVGLPTPRCVVPTRATEELPREPRLLKTVAAHHMLEVGSFGRHVCVGAYAEVVGEGRLRVGERLAVEAVA